MTKRINYFLKDLAKKKKAADDAYIKFRDKNREIFEKLRDEELEEIDNKIIEYQDKIDILEGKIEDLELKKKEISEIEIFPDTDSKMGNNDTNNDSNNDNKESDYHKITKILEDNGVSIEDYSAWLQSLKKPNKMHFEHTYEL